MVEIAEEDRKYLCDDRHQDKVHGIFFYSGMGMVICFLNFAVAFYCFSQSALSEMVAAFAFVGFMVLLPFMIVWQFIPCKCGNLRIYSGKGILRNLEREKVTLPRLLQLVCALSLIGAIGSLGVLFFRETYGVLAARGFAIAMPSAVLFGLVLYARFAPKLFRIMQRKEVVRILSFSGDSVDELLELVEFYSYVGDFDKANEYSQRLVDRCSNPPG